MKKKSLALIIALALILTCAVGGTIAWLVATTDPVTNTFTPGSVTTIVNEDGIGTATKSNVTVTNTGNVNAYIRAAIVINWVDAAGNIYAEVPSTATYSMTYGTDWTKLDGYYYYNGVVTPNGMTANLINTCTESAPEGYHLQVSILAEGIQSEGTTSTGTPAVKEAWGHSFANGSWT